MTAGASRPRAGGVFRGGGSLARALFLGAPRRSLVVAGLLLVSGVTDAFGIALLIPFLSVAGLGAAEAGASPVRDFLAAGAAALGVTLTLPVLLCAFVLLVAVRSTVAWQRQTQMAMMRHGFIDRLRERLYSATAHAGWRFVVRQRRSDLLHVLTHDVNRAAQGVMCILQAAINGTLVVAQLVLAAAISLPVTLGMLLLGGGLLTAGRPLVRRSRGLGRRLTAGGRAVHAAMTGFLDGLKQAKGDAAEARHVAEFSAALAEMRRQQLAFTRTDAAAQSAFHVGSAATLAALAWLAVRHADLGAPELLVMALIAMRVLPAVRRLQQEGQRLAHALPAWLNAVEMERALLDAAEPAAVPGAPRVPLLRELTVHGVSFCYDRRPGGRAALAEIDLVVPAHTLVAVTGPSGAGKSTLTDLLLGLLEPDRGEIRVDGARLAGPARTGWRRSVAYVPQDPCLLHETIRMNLLRARPEATEAELRRALRGAAAAGFVAALPDGLDTVAGDRGARLSGGERQRIVLARALLREPALLLLDEATSQLDAESERQVLAALRALRDRTTIVAVTHRPSVMEAADRVVLLEAGRVAATGTWRELAPRRAGDLPEHRRPPARASA